MESWKVAALRILFQRGARRFTPSRNSLRVKISHGPPRERESHVARNFFLNRLSNIPFHVSSASFLTPRFSSDGRANVKQWKIFERSLPSSRFLPIFARELNNVFFFSLLIFFLLFLFSCMLTSFDRRELAGNEHRRGNFNECKRLISVREVTLSELRDSIARLRERVKLVCRTRGSPPPRVHWLKDGIPLHPRRGLRIQHKR